MLAIFDGLRGMNVLSVVVRMLLAVLCGGLIGVERAFKRRPAGMRTHILICLGAAMTTLTSQYLYLILYYYTDMSRLGAQVVAGIGFIGAGCIIVTRRQRVKGLTTAAGLWLSAIIGLTLGGGFYEGGILATVFVILVELFLSKIEYWMMDNAPEANLYMEYNGRACLEKVLRFFRERDMNLLDIEITRHADGDKMTSCAIFTVRLNRRHQLEHLLEQLRQIRDIVIVEEM